MKKILILMLCFLLSGNSSLSFAFNARQSGSSGIVRNDTNDEDDTRTGQRTGQRNAAPAARQPQAQPQAQDRLPQQTRPQQRQPQDAPSRTVTRTRAVNTPSVAQDAQAPQNTPSQRVVVRREFSNRPAQTVSARPVQTANSRQSDQLANANDSRNVNRRPQGPHSNVSPRHAYEPVRVTTRPNPNRNVVRVAASGPVLNTSRDIYYRNTRNYGPASAIAAVLFFPFSLAFRANHRSTIYVSRPYYYYPYYDYAFYYYSSRLYYSPYWWQNPTQINYNTYNNYTYVQSSKDSADLQAQDENIPSEQSLEDVKIEGAKYIDDPKSVALTITNETKYAVAGVVFAFAFRGSDFTEIIENVHYNFDFPISQYEKRFIRIDLSGVEFQTPESFSIVTVVQSISTDQGQIIVGNQQIASYLREE